MSHLWGDLCQGNGCVDGRLHGCLVDGCKFLVLVDGWMGEEIYALKQCKVVTVMRTRRVAAMIQREMSLETREGKDEIYLDPIVMSEDHGGRIKGDTRRQQYGKGTQP